MLRQLIAFFGVQVDDQQVKDTDKSVDGLIKNLKQLGGVLLGGGLVLGVRSFVKSGVELGDGIGKMSEQIGTSTDALQELRFAAESAGAGSGALDMTLRRLNRRAGQARAGNKAMAQSFKDVGIELTDASGKAHDADALFMQLADRVHDAKDEGEALRLAYQLMGAEGQRLVPMLRQGSKGLEEARKQFRELGGGISEDVVRASEEAADATLAFDTALQSTKSTILSKLLPPLTWMMQRVTKVTAWFNRATKGTNIMEAALLTLGAVGVAVATKLLIAFAPFLLKAAAIAAVFAIVALAVDEVLTFMRGGESIIGDFFDALLGDGAADEIREMILGLIDWFKKLFTDPKEAAKEFFNFLVNDIFKNIGVIIVSQMSGAMRNLVDLIASTVKMSLRLLQPLLKSTGIQVDPLLKGVDQAAKAAKGALTAGEMSMMGGLGAMPPEVARMAAEAAARGSVPRDAGAGGAGAPVVPAPGGGSVHQETNVNAGGIHVHGVSDPDEVARRAVREMERLENRRRREAAQALTRGAPA